MQKEASLHTIARSGVFNSHSSQDARSEEL